MAMAISNSRHICLCRNLGVISCSTSFDDLLYIEGNIQHNLGPERLEENNIVYAGGVSYSSLLGMAQISIGSLTVNAAQHAFPPA